MKLNQYFAISYGTAVYFFNSLISKTLPVFAYHYRSRSSFKSAMAIAHWLRFGKLQPEWQKHKAPRESLLRLREMCAKLHSAPKDLPDPYTVPGAMHTSYPTQTPEKFLNRKSRTTDFDPRTIFFPDEKFPEI